MSNSQQYTEEQIKEALIKAKGMLSIAARSLGCSARTVRNYMSRFPELSEVRWEAKIEIIDMAEVALFKNIKAGKEASVIYALNQLGRDRGYGKRLQAPDMDAPPPTPSGDAGEQKVKIKLDDDTEIEI